MARSRRSAVAARVGVRVPGIYADLLMRERDSDDRSQAPAADRAKRSLGFRRSRHLRDALEAGEPVVVSASQLVSRRVQVPEHMRPGRRAGVRWWRVSPDDVVERANSPVVDRPTRKRRGEAVPG